MNPRARRDGVAALAALTVILVAAAGAEMLDAGAVPTFLASKRPSADSRSGNPPEPASVTSLRGQVETLSERLQELPPGADAAELHRQIAALKGRIERQFMSGLQPASPAPPEVNAWPAGGLAICTATGHQTQPVVASDQAGGAYIAWTDPRAGNSTIYIQRPTFDGSLVAGWNPNGNVVSTDGRPQVQPSIAADGTGAAFVAWSEQHPAGDMDIWMQAIGSNGSPIFGWASTGLLLCVSGGDQKFPVVVADGFGGAIVVWYDRRGGSNWDVYAQRVSGSGVIQWTANGVILSTATWASTSPVLAPRVVSDGAGGAIVAWGNGNFTGSDNIYVQRITSTGTIAPGWPVNGVVACGATGNQVFPDLCSDGAGGAIIAWADYRSDAASDIDAVRITSAGAVAPGWPANGVAVAATPSVAEYGAQIVADGSGGAIVVWQDNRNAATSSYDLWARAIDGSGSFPWGAPGGVSLTEGSNVQAVVSTVTDQNGGVLACWNDYRGADIDVYAQHVTSSGQRGYTANGVARGIGTGDQAVPQLGHRSIAATGAGNAIIVWEDKRNSGSTGIDIYAADLTGLLNLNATAVRAGWSYPLVPRNDATASFGSAVLSATLDGNASTTYVNLSGSQEGPYPSSELQSIFLLDGDLWDNWLFYDPVIAQSYFTPNDGPGTVRGGRHTLTSVMDSGGDVPESNEADNSWSGQFVWSPLATTHAVPLVRQAPPVRGALTYPNSDGFAFSRSAGFAWVTGLAPLNFPDDYDLYVYSDYSGSLAGYSTLAGISTFGVNATDFVVGHYFGTPLTVYPAAIRYSIAGGGGNFAIDQIDAGGRNAGVAGVFNNQSLTANRLVDVYEANLVAGGTYAFTLVRNSGTSDIAFGVYPGTPGGVYDRSSAAASSIPSGPGYDSVTYTAVISDWHPIVVYRFDGNDLSPVTYSLYWGPSTADAGPPVSPPAPLALAGVTPNPVSGPGVLRYSLSRTSPVRLSLFDVNGRELDRLIDGTMEAGAHALNWAPRDGGGQRLASGVYWLALEAEGKRLTSRVVVAR